MQGLHHVLTSSASSKIICSFSGIAAPWLNPDTINSVAAVESKVPPFSVAATLFLAFSYIFKK